jgi:antibiotic biosynthesis monooxygenase (ABM) superfamily enzyme
MVFECLESGKSSSSGNQFMTEAGLVLLELVVLVDLLVVLFVPVCRCVSVGWIPSRKQKMPYPRSPL